MAAYTCSARSRRASVPSTAVSTCSHSSLRISASSSRTFVSSSTTRMRGSGTGRLLCPGWQSGLNDWGRHERRPGLSGARTAPRAASVKAGGYAILPASGLMGNVSPRAFGQPGRPPRSAHRPAGPREADAGTGLQPLADLLHPGVEAGLVHEGLAVGVDHHAAVDHHGVHAAAVGVVDEIV